jgi:hypothetical protein
MPSKISKRLESLIQRKQDAIEINNYEKYIPLFNIAIRFLKKQDKVLMYGGTAINSIMPKRYKFYRSTELPDLDLFSTRGIGLANDLVDEFKKRGYPLATMQEALHIGTYKVIVDGVPIADISNVSQNVFNCFYTDSLIGDLGLRVCNPEFLRSTLYVLLSQPQDSHRWGKVIERLVTFNKVFPVKASIALRYLKLDTPTSTTHLTESSVRTFAKEHDLVWMGPSILQDILKLEPKWETRLKNIPINIPYLFLVNKNAYQIAHRFVKEHPELNLTVGKSTEESDFMQKHTNVYHNNNIVLTITELNNCLSYAKHLNSKITSFSTLLRILYEYYFSELNGYYLAWIHLLIAIEQRHSKSKSNLIQIINTDCNGPAVGIFTLKRKRFQRILENKIRSKS